MVSMFLYSSLASSWVRFRSKSFLFTSLSTRVSWSLKIFSFLSLSRCFCRAPLWSLAAYSRTWFCRSFTSVSLIYYKLASFACRVVSFSCMVFLYSASSLIRSWSDLCTRTSYSWAFSRICTVKRSLSPWRRLFWSRRLSFSWLTDLIIS